MKPFTRLEIPGKWVLSGEHSVLRGVEAVALPHPEYRLKLEWQEAEGWGFEVVPIDADSMVRAMIGQIERKTRLDLISRLSGRLTMKSTIPVGSGLGSSAALCVGVVRWLNETVLKEALLSELETATELEDVFHGKSSGMDVAVVSRARAIRFVSGQAPVELELKRLPHFTFHDTGRRSSTRRCIEIVQALRERDPKRFAEIDARMGEASRLALQGLELFPSSNDAGLERLTRAMDLGQACFEDWDLGPAGAQAQMEELRRRGALAVKLTGAGLGGFLVALWGASARDFQENERKA